MMVGIRNETRLGCQCLLLSYVFCIAEGKWMIGIILHILDVIKFLEVFC